MKEIYILLTNSTTLISKAISLCTKAEYTHVALAMDKDLTMLYSFGRKFKWSMVPSGFVREGVNHGVMGDSENMKCALYTIQISDNAYQRLANRLRHMESKKNCYRFNYLGLPMCGFGWKSGGKNVFFCSMSSSNCCFLACIQISQEADQVVWYSHLFQNFPQFIVIHTVKCFDYALAKSIKQK